MSVRVDDRNLKRSIERMQRLLGDKREVFRLISRNLRDYVKDTIRMGGRGVPYAPLSSWTHFRTGRIQPLVTIISGFRAKATSRTAEVYFVPPRGKDFNINWHHQGARIPARVPAEKRAMRVPLFGGGAVFFMRAGPGKIPARKIWPTSREATAESAKIIKDWIQSGARKNWR